jgi:hypothetical protein
MGLVPTELKDADIIIGKLQERCNAGRNCHVWGQKFSSRVQRDTESADSWLSDLRDLARKCEFEKDCCTACQNTRILGQVVFGVFDDEVRRKLLELGATLTLDMALTMLRTAEATRLQASTIKQGGAAPVHQLKTPAAKPPMGKPATQHRDQHRGRPAARWHPPGTKPYGCWNCGSATRHAKEDCPAFGKECLGCHKTGHFQAVCTQGSSSTPMSGGASPSQIVFNRPTRDLLPAHRRSFAPEWQQAAELLEKRAQHANELQIQHFNRSTHPLPPLVIGDCVVIQDHKSKRWSTPGVIVEVGPFRDYLVKTPAGRLFRRNRRFLRVSSPRIPQPQPRASTPTTDTPLQWPGPAPPTAPSTSLRRSRRLAAKISS